MSLLIFSEMLLVFYLKIDYSVLTQEHQCAFKHTLCDSSMKDPCCDSKDECKQTWPDNYFRCVGDVMLWGLGKFCERDDDCDEIIHAKCSKDHKCVCRKNNVKIDPWRCAPILGEFCWKNESCATNNAICINNTCRCASNYQRSKDQCIRKILGASCIENVKICDQIRFASCSKDKICACSFNTTTVGLTHCAPIVGGFCFHTDECVTRNSECIDNRCKCREKFEYFSDHLCKRVSPSAPITRAICFDTDNCMCFGMNENELWVCTPTDNIHCTINANCPIANSTCLNNICQCKPGFLFRFNRCDAVYLNDTCTHDSDCNRINHAVCSLEKVCACDKNYIDWNGTSCRPLIDGFCSSTEDCLAVNSICIENKCQCTTDQIQYSNNLCIKPHLRMICENDIDCDELLYSRCDRNKRCGCEPNYKEYNVTACAPLLGRYCSNDKLCAVSHSSCLENKCLCNFGFVKFSLEKCVPHHIGMECVENADCRLVLNSVCINNHCVCKSNHVGLNDKVCAPTLDARCKRNQQCAPSNSICVNNKCQCGHNYLRTTKNQCVTFNEYFRKSCENSNDCEDIQYSECSVTKKCTCKMNYIPLGNKKCIALIGAFCNDNDECISIDTSCINNKCQCRKNFYAHSKQQCYPIQLGTTCQNNDDCSEAIRNSKCSTDKRCNCIENHYALNEFECAPYLFGNCFSDEDCKFNSSVCVGNKCMCKIDSRAVSDNQCQLIEYMYTCDNELDCGDPWHYRCDPDKRCRCNSNNYSINRSTCLPLLKGYCWKDSQCLTVNSACIDFHCQCRSNFIAICNNLCRPVDNLTQFFF